LSCPWKFLRPSAAASDSFALFPIKHEWIRHLREHVLILFSATQVLFLFLPFMLKSVLKSEADLQRQMTSEIWNLPENR
jgi:hypothetical protein